MAPSLELRRLIQWMISIFRYLKIQVGDILYLLKNRKKLTAYRDKASLTCLLSPRSRLKSVISPLWSQGAENISTDLGPAAYGASDRFFKAGECVKKNWIQAGVSSVSCSLSLVCVTECVCTCVCVCVWTLYTAHLSTIMWLRLIWNKDWHVKHDA